MNTIADHVSACLQEFNSLCSSSPIWDNGIPDEGTESNISIVKIQNELSRFKVWSGNIGAHKKGRSSLDHRLRDASNIRNQVVELLEDLRESLQDAKDILTGKITPWDQDLTPAKFSDDDSDDESFQFDVPGTHELSQIFAAIVEDINCLLRLSVSIHNPASHDRFKKASLTDTSDYEPFDVQHVCNKLSEAPKPVAERLGKAITRRRQYFKYRELHHDKLTSGLELDDDDQTQSTVASSLPKNLKENELISMDKEVDDVSDAVRSQTSWATSVANPDRPKIPALPVEAENGPFECPFCFMMISIASKNHWKKHVFSDLFPYICIESDCPAPDQDFQRRHEWADHVKKHHWKTWTCSLGCNENFDSSQDMKRHLTQKHSGMAELAHLDSLLTMCERPRSESEPTGCPLCNERQSSFKQYKRHVGRHQEDLALFALPKLEDEEEGKRGEEEDEAESDDESQEAEQEGTGMEALSLLGNLRSYSSQDRMRLGLRDSDSKSVSQHLIDCHSLEDMRAAAEAKRIQTRRKRRLACFKCDYRTDRAYNLQRHMNIRHSEPRAPEGARTQDETKTKDKEFLTDGKLTAEPEGNETSP
ncbi:zinc finger transcription factor ace1 [Fusarium pseudoanthophilum]|uniref:Zinc finger transcription factor ace1 n=1 Tax=Fusarium pseudoanthophilum TaxID=48495 RepID=A0A8H5P520_9HYPO|nr:zinc finger transcription factor ace1 [Fusarium pseudoanthophilum]